MDLTPLAQYGSTGIAIGLVILVAWLVKMFVDHSKECRSDVTGVIKDHAKVQSENTEAIRDLRRTIESKL